MLMIRYIMRRIWIECKDLEGFSPGVRDLFDGSVFFLPLMSRIRPASVCEIVEPAFSIYEVKGERMLL